MLNYNKINEICIEHYEFHLLFCNITLGNLRNLKEVCGQLIVALSVRLTNRCSIVVYNRFGVRFELSVSSQSNTDFSRIHNI